MIVLTEAIIIEGLKLARVLADIEKLRVEALPEAERQAWAKEIHEDRANVRSVAEKLNPFTWFDQDRERREGEAPRP